MSYQGAEIPKFKLLTYQASAVNPNFLKDLARRVRSCRAWELHLLLPFYNVKSFPEFKKRGGKDQMMDKICRAIQEEARLNRIPSSTIAALER